MTHDYTEFLTSKLKTVEDTGFDIMSESSLNPALYPFQKAIVRWALKRGRAAIFAKFGLGKTFMQLEWANRVADYSGGKVLIIAPLMVTEQTVREGEKFGVPVRAIQGMSDVGTARIVITNYERLHLIDPSAFAGVVLDESSILKNLGGKTFWQLVRMFADTRYKLCCTATPAPNEYVEFSNHSTFLGIMHFKEVLARWFTGDTKIARTAILKPHAVGDWWRWVTSWAVCISKPSDLGDGYHMDGYDLPELRIHEHRLSSNSETIARTWGEGKLLPDDNPTATTLHKVKRESLKDRVAKTVDIIGALPDDRPAVLWCDTNYEADALMKAFPEAVEVRGNHTSAQKEERLRAFTNGSARMIITKPEIAGFGLNWQHCADQVFIGVSFSFERFYQGLHRLYRYGQTRPVNTHLIYAESEGNVLSVLNAKRAAFDEMQTAMNAAMAKHGLFRTDKPRVTVAPTYDRADGERWTLYKGDCVTVSKDLPDNSVHLTVHSPPFANLYTYSDSWADMGNSADNDEFFAHYDFLIREMWRITLPGRLCVVHCKDLPKFKNRDGAMGLYDFPGDVRKHFEANDWTLHSKVTIWKDPVVEMERTNNHGLLHRSFVANAEVCRQGMPDYLYVFRKWPVEGGEPVSHANLQIGRYIGTKPPAEWEYRFMGRRSPREKHSIAVWQRYASPVWFDIDQMRVLNYKQAKDPNDEKHICPLQLDVIERCIELWTNPDDIVFSPFAGIGSELVSAVKMGRRALGIELKDSYWQTAQKFLHEAEHDVAQPTLFDLLPAEELEVTA
jgi:DNA modification methylase